MPVDHADLTPKQIRTCARDDVGGPHGFLRLSPGLGVLFTTNAVEMLITTQNNLPIAQSWRPVKRFARVASLVGSQDLELVGGIEDVGRPVTLEIIDFSVSSYW